MSVGGPASTVQKAYLQSNTRGQLQTRPPISPSSMLTTSQSSSDADSKFDDTSRFHLGLLESPSAAPSRRPHDQPPISETMLSMLTRSGRNWPIETVMHEMVKQVAIWGGTLNETSGAKIHDICQAMSSSLALCPGVLQMSSGTGSKLEVQKTYVTHSLNHQNHMLIPLDFSTERSTGMLLDVKKSIDGTHTFTLFEADDCSTILMVCDVKDECASTQLMALLDGLACCNDDSCEHELICDDKNQPIHFARHWMQQLSLLSGTSVDKQRYHWSMPQSSGLDPLQLVETWLKTQMTPVNWVSFKYHFLENAMLSTKDLEEKNRLRTQMDILVGEDSGLVSRHTHSSTDLSRTTTSGPLDYQRLLDEKLIGLDLPSCPLPDSDILLPDPSQQTSTVAVKSSSATSDTSKHTPSDISPATIEKRYSDQAFAELRQCVPWLGDDTLEISPVDAFPENAPPMSEQMRLSLAQPVRGWNDTVASYEMEQHFLHWVRTNNPLIQYQKVCQAMKSARIFTASTVAKKMKFGIASIIGSIQRNGQTLIPIGILGIPTTDDSHTTLLDVKRETNGAYTLALINTGFGLDYHPSRWVDGRRKYETCLSVCGIKHEYLQPQLEKLLGPLYQTKETKHGESDQRCELDFVYGSIHRLARLPGARYSAEQPHSESPQKGMSCVVKSMESWLKIQIGPEYFWSFKIFLLEKAKQSTHDPQEITQLDIRIKKLRQKLSGHVDSEQNLPLGFTWYFSEYKGISKEELVNSGVRQFNTTIFRLQSGVTVNIENGQIYRRDGAFRYIYQVSMENREHDTLCSMKYVGRCPISALSE